MWLLHAWKSEGDCFLQCGKKRNEKAEKRATAAILAAQQIPDEYITMDDGEACAFVTSSRSETGLR